MDIDLEEQFTWSVRSLYRGGNTQDLRRILTEIRSLGKGKFMDKIRYHCDFYYSYVPKNIRSTFCSKR